EDSIQHGEVRQDDGRANVQEEANAVQGRCGQRRKSHFLRFPYRPVLILFLSDYHTPGRSLFAKEAKEYLACLALPDIFYHIKNIN
ncbi:MAG: hypothetical protein FWD23_17250, partial [Oscillospiraceae bacterium]|nr:hypothetical protein [Oscillospiraceae bacterium]